ncbi:MAG: hypothetical protein C0507_07675 [Cyanobacteria bacterium PR.3.49]|nr:hypothetical protein [Cyanobacteria bacterium PR.3.49]
MTMTPTTNDPLIGKILAERYRITELVGSGRFSIVYKGQHLFMDRAVAMKTLQANLAEDQTVIKRFEKEAVALSKLRHPNIVSVYDCFVHTNGQPFLVMDFLDGHTLEELLTDRGAIPPKLMRAIVFQASAGLAHAHGSGVLHRDIKPDNIILLPREKTDERVRLLDFGFALLQGDMERLTLSGTLCGSPAYISPERWKGKELDARSDIYSLAVVMYQGLTGQLPFKAASLEELRNMHVGQEPPQLGDILPALKEDTVAQSILIKAMAKDPDERYQTMKEFHNAVKLWSPNSDDAEIAQWAKNVMPKPAPQAVPNAVQAQPISLQPPPGVTAAGGSFAAPGAQAAPAQAAQAAPATPAPAAPGAPTAPGQQVPFNAAQPVTGQAPGQLAQAMQMAQSASMNAQDVADFDDVTTLPTNQATPKFDDVATLQDKAVGPTFDEIETLQSAKAGDNGEASFVELPDSETNQPAAGNAAMPNQNAAQRTVEVSLEQGSPLSPEAMARIQIPNPRASLTKQDVAYIKAIAQTLGDSLGDQAKSIEMSPSLEGLPMRDETSKLSFNSMPAPASESKGPEAGPKIVPVVDRRQKKTGEDGFADEAGAGSSSPGTAGSAQQNVASEWSAKQEVAPWVNNPDEFKPKPGFGETAPSFGTGPSGPSPFGAPASGPPVPPGFGAPAPGAPGSPALGAAGASASPFMSNAAPPNAFGAPPGTPPGTSPGTLPGAPPVAPAAKDPSTISSSRISPMMPGSSTSGAHNAAPPSAVPWTNATSSSPVDFGKIFDDKSPPEPSVPIPPSPISNSLGTEIASPTASAANLSIAGGNDRPAPPKGEKKRNRLPTFVDRDAPPDAQEEAAPKKSMGGLLIGGAVAVFIFAGIGIATWLMTNVNPSNTDANTNAAVVAPVKGGSSQDNQPAASAPPAKDTTAATNNSTDTASKNDSAGETAKTPDEPVKTTAAPLVKPAAKPPKTEAPKTASKPSPPPEAAKEAPSARGWFGMPTFNQQKEEERAAAKPATAVTADASHESPAAKPKKKKPKRKKAAVAQRSSGSSSSGGLSGGYVEVEVTPGRRAYRSY